jgi:hypothetical protein
VPARTQGTHEAEARAGKSEAYFGFDRRRKAAANAHAWKSWLADRLAQERTLVLEAVGEGVAELLDEARQASKDQLRDELREIQIELVEAQAQMADLRATGASNRADGARCPEFELAGVAYGQLGGSWPQRLTEKLRKTLADSTRQSSATYGPEHEAGR